MPALRWPTCWRLRKPALCGPRAAATRRRGAASCRPTRDAGRRPERGEMVRPLAGTSSRQRHCGHACRTAYGALARRQAPPDRADMERLWFCPTPSPAVPTFRLVAIYDPRYKEPLLLATNLERECVGVVALVSKNAGAWSICRLPPSRCWGVSGPTCSGRKAAFACPNSPCLPATSWPTWRLPARRSPRGFWDRAARPTVWTAAAGAWAECIVRTCPLWQAQLRKKNSVTAHLKTGVDAHRRCKAQPTHQQAAQAAEFTGN